MLLGGGGGLRFPLVAETVSDGVGGRGRSLPNWEETKATKIKGSRQHDKVLILDLFFQSLDPVCLLTLSCHLLAFIGIFWIFRGVKAG